MAAHVKYKVAFAVLLVAIALSTIGIIISKGPRKDPALAQLTKQIESNIAAQNEQSASMNFIGGPTGDDNLRAINEAKAKGEKIIVTNFIIILVTCLDFPMLSKGGLDKTQKAITEEIGENFFPNRGKINQNVWTRILEPWAVKNIMVRITGNMAKPVDVTRCATLSEIRRNLKVHQSDGDAVFQYSGKILVNKKMVLVGKASYSIMKRRNADAIEVPIKDGTGKTQWIRMDALLALLSNLKKTAE